MKGTISIVLILLALVVGLTIGHYALPKTVEKIVVKEITKDCPTCEVCKECPTTESTSCTNVTDTKTVYVEKIVEKCNAPSPNTNLINVYVAEGLRDKAIVRTVYTSCDEFLKKATERKDLDGDCYLGKKKLVHYEQPRTNMCKLVLVSGC
jgi:hypothetical protein